MKDIDQLAKKIADRYGIETYNKSKEVKYPPHWITSLEDNRILDTNIKFYKSGIIHLNICTNFKYSDYWMCTLNTLYIIHENHSVKVLLPKLFLELEQLDLNSYSVSFSDCDKNELTLQLTPNDLLE